MYITIYIYIPPPSPSNTPPSPLIPLPPPNINYLIDSLYFPYSLKGCALLFVAQAPGGQVSMKAAGAMEFHAQL